MNRSARLACILLPLSLLVQTPVLAAINVWTPLNNGLAAGSVTEISVDPRASDVLYIATAYGGLYKSIDRGGTWRPLLNSPSGGFTNSLLIDPRDPSTLHLASISGVSKSSDGGETWTAERKDLGNVYQLAFDSRNSHTLYAATSDGVAKTTDGGNSWQMIALWRAYEETELPVLDARPYGIVVDPTNGRRVYVHTSDGVFLSEDEGSSWDRIFLSPGASEDSELKIDPTNPSRMISTASTGIYLSEDRGQNWSFYSVFGTYVYDVAFHPTNPNILYAASGSSLYISRDSGRTWDLHEEGNYFWALSLATDPRRPETLYVGTIGGFKRTSTSCCGPLQDSNQGLYNYLINDMVRDPRDPSRFLFASIFGVHASSDSGQSWYPVEQSFGTPNAGEFVYHPLDSSIVYATPSPRYFGFIWHHMIKSVDGGESWEPSFTLPDRSGRSFWIEHFQIDPRNPDVFYMVTESLDLFRSEDAGATWVQDSDGLVGSGYTASIQFDPTDPEKLYLKSRNLLYQQSGRGQPWTTLFERPRETGTLGALAIDPETPSTLYLGGRSYVEGFDPVLRGLVYKSLDRGQTWRLVLDSTLLHSVVDLKIDPQNPRTLYAASNAILKSTNAGASWNRIDRGLPDGLVGTLDVDPDSPTTLLAATVGYGIWELTQAIDLDLHVTPSVDTLFRGTQALTYTVALANQGLLAASEVHIELEFDAPPGVTVQTILPEDNTTYTDGTWSIERLKSGASTLLTVQFLVDDTAPAGQDIISVTARVQEVTETDPFPANNTAKASTSILSLRW